MRRVFVSVGVSLDGYIAGPNGGAANPLGDNGTAIHDWVFRQRGFRWHLGWGDDGETGPDNDVFMAIYNRTGANIMGKKMFIVGEANWPENAPFHCPVFVMTREERTPWERPGGTTFYFTRDSLENVLEKSKTAAGIKDVRISGGANVIQQFLNAGLVDELIVHQSPVLMGGGVRLFENIDKNKVCFENMSVISSPGVTHHYYLVKTK